MFVYQLDAYYLDRNGLLKKRKLDKWESEPDFVEGFQDKCHMVVWRNAVYGNLNGYVGVKRDHPYFGKSMHEPKNSNIKVHWGVTFAGKRIGEGFKKGYWYFGFDTNHAFDFSPTLEKILDERRKNGYQLVKLIDNLFTPFLRPEYSRVKPTYKDLDFVTREVETMFFQLDMARKRNPDNEHNFNREYKQLHIKR
jgi:hypothetical protein